MASSIRVVEDLPVLRIRLSRADRRNAFDEELIASLTEAFTGIAPRTDVRAVILEGEGSVFCAGADMDWMRRAAQRSEEENKADALRMAAMFQAIATCPIPVLARAHGAALGGGMGLLAASDIAVAASDAVFGFTEVRLGIIPAVISPYVLRKSAPGPVRRYFLTGERFGAEEARRIGLVDVVADPAELDASMSLIVDALLAAAPGAQREAKALLAGSVMIGDDVTDRTAAWIARVRAGDEAKEGFRAFLERRPAPWSAPAPGGAR